MFFLFFLFSENWAKWHPMLFPPISAVSYAGCCVFTYGLSFIWQEMTKCSSPRMDEFLLYKQLHPFRSTMWVSQIRQRITLAVSVFAHHRVSVTQCTSSPLCGYFHLMAPSSGVSEQWLSSSHRLWPPCDITSSTHPPPITPPAGKEKEIDMVPR